MSRKICENCGCNFYSDDEDEFYCCEECEREANGEDEEEDEQLWTNCQIRL